jgi:hypothetical protein
MAPLRSVLDPQIKLGFFQQKSLYITGSKNFFDLNDEHLSSGSPKRTLNSYQYEIYPYFLTREAFLDLDIDPLTGLSLNPIGIQIHNTRNN